MAGRRTATVTARVSATDVERERTRQVRRIGNNLNHIARWAIWSPSGGHSRRWLAPRFHPTNSSRIARSRRAAQRAALV